MEKSTRFNKKDYIKAKKNKDIKLLHKMSFDLYEKQHIKQAIKLQFDCLELGSVSAMVTLSKEYKDGEYLPKDLQESFRLAHKAACHGDIRAMFLLYEFYYYGLVHPCDKELAISWLEKSASHGFINACNTYGFLCRDDKIGNIDKALKFLTNVNENERSFKLISELFGKQANLSKKLEWLKKGVDHDCKYCCHDLADYYYSEGKVEDSIELFEKAANNGSHGSLNNLAIIFRSDEFFDLDKAIDYTKRLADLNLGNSCFNLMLLYFNHIPDEFENNINYAIKAHEAGNHNIYSLLCLYYRTVHYDLEKHNHWAKIGIEINDLNCISSLVNIYIDIDTSKSIRYLNKLKGVSYELESFVPSDINISCIEKLKSNPILCANLYKFESAIHSFKMKTVEKNNIEISHFTNWSAIESILPKDTNNNAKILRLYNVKYMNDPSEGVSLLKIKTNNNEINQSISIIKKILKYIKTSSNNYKEYLLPDIYSLSFTESSDRLDLWRAYGNDGDGFCIKVQYKNSSKISKKSSDCFLNSFYQQFTDSSVQPENKEKTELEVINENSNLYRMVYTDNQKIDFLTSISDFLNIIMLESKNLDKDDYHFLINNVYAILLEVLFLFKDNQYSTEKELRFITSKNIHQVFLDERKPERLYIPTSDFIFKNDGKVIIGPKVRDKEVYELNLRYRLVKNELSNNFTVKRSEIEYR